MPKMKDTRFKLEVEVKNRIATSPTSKVKVSEIADAVGISHSTIYNRYPEIITSIKTHNLTVALANEDSTQHKLKKQKADKNALKKENQELKQDIAKLTSINARYEMENAELVNKISQLEKELAKLINDYGNIRQL